MGMPIPTNVQRAPTHQYSLQSTLSQYEDKGYQTDSLDGLVGRDTMDDHGVTKTNSAQTSSIEKACGTHTAVLQPNARSKKC